MTKSKNTRSIAGAALVAGAVACASPASAQLSTTANGPYYATPSWDQKITTGRFVVLANWNNEAVLDRETGLVWMQTPHPFAVFGFVAGSICLNTSTGGRRGWRLPTAHEIGSLLDPTATVGPPLPAGHPFSGVGARASFWTATTTGFSRDQALVYHWGIDPGGALSMSVDSRSTTLSTTDSYFSSTMPFQAWCVRGGVLSAPQ